MDYNNVILDFAERTRKNLQFVQQTAQREAASHEKSVYEVTQLINSMLGLLVFPQQKHFHAIPETPLAELPAQGWPRIRPTGGFPDAANLRELVRYLRNAVAHFNVQFLAPSGQIEGIRLWNNRNGKKSWEAELTLADLEALTSKFIDSLDEWTKRSVSGEKFSRLKGIAK